MVALERPVAMLALDAGVALPGYVSSENKAVVTARMYFLAGLPAEPLGPGSKEKKSALLAMGRAVGLDLSGVSGKHECGRRVAMLLGVTWDEACVSTGDTVTLTGLNRLVDAQVVRVVAADPGSGPEFLRDIMELNPAPLWSDFEEDTMAVVNEEIELSIREAIAELLQEGPIPEGADIDEDFVSLAAGTLPEPGRWRQALIAVQGWLHLDDVLAPGTIGEFDVQMAKVLHLENISSISEQDYLGALLTRLERAVAYRDEFLEELEGDSEGRAALPSASINWRQKWEDVDSVEGAQKTDPIDAFASTWSINQFRTWSMRGDLELSPPYQRADVWSTSDAQLLIESILRGIPLPSLILRELHGDNGVHYEIIDGKQRLTSILRFTGSHPRAERVVRERAEAWGMDGDDALRLFRSDYPQYRKLWAQHDMRKLTSKLEQEYCFPFKLRDADIPAFGERSSEFNGAYYTDLKNRRLQVSVGGKAQLVEDLFELSVDYVVPVIIYRTQAVRQIHEVFSLYNRQGKRLNAEEIRNAAYHELAMMKALLATSGDAEDYRKVAPFLAPYWDDLATTGSALGDQSGQYALKRAGYVRTRMLSWIAAALLIENNGPVSQSTTAYIDSLLQRIADNPGDPLRAESRVARFMRVLDGALDAHMRVPDHAWYPKFKNEQGRGRWQMLQLVAVLTALAAAYVVLDEEIEDRAFGAATEIAERSRNWRRPLNAQSKVQWDYIGGVVGDMLDLLGVDVAEADEKLRAAYGSSGLLNLVESAAAVH